MANPNLNWIANYIWGIADDVLRDVYVRGKYRDVILPMTVLQRLDAVLEPTKQAVLDRKASLDDAGITNQDAALRQAAGQAFCNTSKFTLRDLRARASRQQHRADFVHYLDGFSPNAQDLLDSFEFRNQIPRLDRADGDQARGRSRVLPDHPLQPVSAEGGVGLLDEYRNRLIADVVTGKLDVREAAARPPETDRLAADGEWADTIATEPHSDATEHYIAKEATK